MIVANILAEVIISLSPDAYRKLSNAGIFIVSGIIKKKENDVKRALLECGFKIKDTYLKDDWVAIISVKEE